jgi:hypothetical protein
VEREHRPPIKQPKQPPRLKQRGLAKLASSVRGRFDPKVQYGRSGHSHFGSKGDVPVGLDADDSPEVQGITET